MNRRWHDLIVTLSVASCLLAIAADQVTQGGEGAAEPKILARAVWPFAKADPEGPKKGEQAVIRSPAELTTRHPWSELDAQAHVVEKMATAQIAKMLKVPEIDWSKQMVILVTAGIRPTGGWKVNVDALKLEGKTLNVAWSVTAPKGASTDAFTHPGQVVLIERFDGPVTFSAKMK